MAGARIVLNSRYIHIAQPGEKAGKYAMTKDAAAGLAEYIGTREGVSLNLNEETLNKNTTRNQNDIIEELLKYVPESKDTFEYRDYKDNPTVGNASEYITRASELGQFGLVDIGEATNLIEYVAKRPGAVRVGEHGLFSSSAEVDLKKVQEEISNCKGRIWTHVVSIRREDADRLGYDTQQPWRNMVLSQLDNIAKQSNIPLQNLHWYAGMHNTGHHPHIHLIVFSDNPKEGKLTAEGIKAMKAGFSQSIFHDERLHIYEQKTQLRDDIKNQIEIILDRLDTNPEKQFSDKEAAIIYQKLSELGAAIKELPGRHVYKFLPKELKPVVDELMALLVKVPEIQRLYELYCGGHAELEKMYRLNPNDVNPIVDNKEFYSIKNQIVTQAEKLAEELEQKSGRASAFQNEPVELASNPESQTAPHSDGNLDSLYENIPPEQEFQAPPYEQSDDDEYSVPHSDDNLSSLYDSVPPESENQTNPIDDYEPPVESEPNQSKANGSTPNGKFNSNDRKTDTFEETYTKAMNGNAEARYQLAKKYLYGTDVEKDYIQAQMWYGLAATSGHSRAKYELGKMYLYGIGIEKDLILGKEYCLDAYWDFRSTVTAEIGYDVGSDIYANTPIQKLGLPALSKGSAYLEYCLGRMEYAGEGVEKNNIKAHRWFESAAYHKHVHSDYYLGKLSYTGEGVTQSYTDAAEHYEAAANGKDKYAYYAIGKMHFDGKGVKQDYAQAAQWFSQASKEDVSYADYQLAKMCEKGLGLDQDTVVAGILYKKALGEFLGQEKQQSDGFIECRIGQIYSRGEGTPVDVSEAIKWFTAAEQNEKPHAAYCLGKLYLQGNGIEQNYVTAFRYLLKAAEQEDKNAYYMVGSMYLDGKGVQQDYLQAAKWLEKSSDENLPYADYKLAGMYFEGKGVTRDETKAFDLYQKALSEYLQQEEQQPDSAVEYRIAQMYENGQGCKANVTGAAKWFTKAAEGSHSYAQYKLSKLYLSNKGIRPDAQAANLYHKMALKSFIKEDTEAPDGVRESIIAKMFLQGDSYALGFGSAPNYEAAVQWLQKSIQSGNSEAALDLAKLFESGQGVKKDLSKVQQLYGVALQGFEKQYAQIKLEDRNIERQSILAYRIARLYLEGKGAPGDAVQALNWFMKSADLNNSVAQYQIGKMLLAGTGGIKDEHRAFEYFMRSAQSANEYAQYQVGKMFEKGIGVIADEQAAKHWYQVSAENGNKAAQSKLEQLETGQKINAPGVLGTLMRLLAHNMGDHITDSTTRKFRQDKKLLQKQRQMKAAQGHKDEIEESM